MRGIARFNFNELCNQNLGGEDYIEIANCCHFITIENIPNFNNENADMQQRFITLIDIFYEKKIPLLISSNFKPNELNSADRLKQPFKRTISRIYELTSPEIKIV
ncbi:MAG: AFG1/ZapE family ATPase [Pelagibacteraceae bacterium]